MNIRACPRKKDYVSMTVDGECKQMQKRLLLANLKELHIEFTIYNTVQYSLPVTSRGMHSMCVCEHHQNIKLLMPAIPQHTEYTDLLKKIVCSINSRVCMMQVCDKCPGKTALNEYLLQLYSDNIWTCKTWSVSSSGFTLIGLS
jgi:hypothetical protein